MLLSFVSTVAAEDDPLKDPFGDELSMATPPPPSPEQMPTIRESTVRRAPPSDVCPSPRSLKTIRQLSDRVAAAKGEFPPECSLGQPAFQPRRWAPKTFTWTASGLCHRPLYFEDEQLERYGHSRAPLVQAVLSPAKFFLTFPVLPYEMGLYPPRECIYTLGYYRPGDYSPYMFDAIPFSMRAAACEAGAVTGALFALP